MGTEAGPAFELPPGTGQVFDQVKSSQELLPGIQEAGVGYNVITSAAR